MSPHVSYSSPKLKVCTLVNVKVPLNTFHYNSFCISMVIVSKWFYICNDDGLEIVMCEIVRKCFHVSECPFLVSSISSNIEYKVKVQVLRSVQEPK